MIRFVYFKVGVLDCEVWRKNLLEKWPPKSPLLPTPSEDCDIAVNMRSEKLAECLQTLSSWVRPATCM